jgi:hypothetical protein
MLMRSILAFFTFLLCVVGGLVKARAASEIVIAIRYLQREGTSHSHLYLYREDGKLLRQLTNDNSGQEIDPIFAPSGETIVFTREIAEGNVQYWSVEPQGKGLKRLDAAPDWYKAAKTSPFFKSPEIPADEPAENTEQAEFGSRIQRFKAPDGSVETVLREVETEDADQINGPGHGKHYTLRNLKSGKEVEFGEIPGFEGTVEQLKLRDQRDRYLIEPPLRVAFYGLHIDSMEGDTSFALDLAKQRFVRLSPGWAAPFPLPGEAAFLTLSYPRYVPIPGSKKTANCSYMERWDSSLKKIRYAREGTAAICYGASMYRPGKTPRTIHIRKSGD